MYFILNMFGNNKKNNLSRYKGVMGEMSGTELQVSGWYVRHRELLRRVGIGILAFFGIGMFLIGLTFGGIYLFFGYSQDEAMFREQVAGFPDYASIHALYEARELQVSRPEVFESAPGKYDFAVDVSNPNERWVAVITYTYIHSRGETAPREAVILPGSSRPVVALGEDADRFPSSPRLLITDTNWVKINAHAVSDVAAYMEERLLFDYENIEFTPARASDDISAHRLVFDLSNQSAYSYWQPLFLVELFEQNRRVGILPVTVDQFEAGETRTIDLRSLAGELDVTDIVVHSIINVFDQREFMEPRA
jgi:hypothetical protein